MLEPRSSTDLIEKVQPKVEILPLSTQILLSAARVAKRVFPGMPLIERPELGLLLSLGQPLTNPVLAIAGIADLQYWVALAPNQPRQVVGLTGLYRNLEDKDSDLAYWLAYTCVAPEFRGQGIGGQLLDFAIAQAQSKGKQFLRLYTSNAPQYAIAQHLYSSRGFYPIGKQEIPKSPYQCLFKELWLCDVPKG